MFAQHLIALLVVLTAGPVAGALSWAARGGRRGGASLLLSTLASMGGAAAGSAATGLLAGHEVASVVTGALGALVAATVLFVLAPPACWLGREMRWAGE